MRKYFSITVSILGLILAGFLSTLAQVNPSLTEPDVKIPISVISEDDTSSYGKLLANRLQQAVSKTGMSEYQSYNFVLFPKVNILSQDLTSSAPTLTVVNLEVTLIVANGYRNKSIIFNSETFSLKGVGQSQERAMLEAIRSFRSSDPRLQEFIIKSRETIVRYFAANCESIISEAQQMGNEALLAVGQYPDGSKSTPAENQFAQAIALLHNIRSANYSCYQSSIEKINQILKKYDEFACLLYLGRAKNHWAARELKETVSYLNRIPPSQSCRADVDALLKQMDNYQETITNEKLLQELRVLREREKAGKEMLDYVMASQKNESPSVRDARKQETIINVLGPPVPTKN